MLDLATPVQLLKGVGPRNADALKKRGVETVEDLLYHLPFRYEDRHDPKPLSALSAGEMASVIGEVRGSVLLHTRASMPIFEMTVGQGLSTLKAMWFRASYLKDKFRPGQTVALYGKLEPSRSTGGQFKMIQPQFELLPEPGDPTDELAPMLEIGRIVPVYESLGGTTPWGAKLGSRWLRQVVWKLLEDLEAGPPLPEPVPVSLTRRLGLPPRLRSLREAHFPPAGTSLTHLQSFSTPAQQRLIFEELFYLELGLELKRKRLRDRAGVAFTADENVRNAIKAVLPFRPTAAQKRVFGEIVEDMRRPQPMRRLLQGDVGSGKTIVAIEAALVAIENGYQAVLMAPTEILATQHYISARKLLSRSTREYKVTLLTGSLETAQKRRSQGRIARGEAELIIGTQALIQQKVDFAALGLVIVDEQHRFGVRQRFTLMKKPGTGDPDVLVMTATPIPRTLALTIYGDLDVSVIDELPPGRTPITTRRTTGERAPEVWEFLRKQVAAGRQAYIVYPVIEGNKDDQPELDFPNDTPDPAELTGPAEPSSAKNLDRPSPRKRNPSTSSPQPERNSSTPPSQPERNPPPFSSRPERRAVERPAGNPAAQPSPPAKQPRAKKAASLNVSANSIAAKRVTKSTQAASKPNLRSATEMYEELRHGALHGLRLGLLHGRLPPNEKEIVMRQFSRGEIDVLISTTVIEVGVDVPNATLMVIEHAERFGMAQMHQLRGRVGRGAAKSFCILMTGGRVSPEAEQRLDAMVRSQNGFELAELDLQQRGPGEFFGTKQAGMPDFRVSNLVRDRRILELAKHEAEDFANLRTKDVTEAERATVRHQLKQHWQRRYGLVEA